MANILRADIYRILRGKALYITFASLLALHLLILTTSQNGVIGASMFEINATLGEEETFIYDADMSEINVALGAEETFIYDGLHIPYVLYTSTDNLAYFMLSLIILAAAPMFSHNTVKNGLSCGISRAKLYFSKLLLSAALTFLLLVFYIADGIIIATLLRGYGGSPPDGYWLYIIKVCSAQFVLMFALDCVGVFLVFTFKRVAPANGVFIAFCLVPYIVIMALMQANPDYIKLYDYNLLSGIRKLGFMSALGTADIIRAFATGLFYIIAPTAAGVILFNRAEIK